MTPSTQQTDRSQPLVVTTIDEARRQIMQARGAGRKIGLVPTMGALHAGHLSLVNASRRECDLTVVTIFVNPTQFGPNEDYSRYPRTLESDLKLLGEHQVELVFAPTVDQMYPAGSTTFVEVGAVAEPLEGVRRPGHFRGVATIVLKLFNAVPADVAFFGQKDYQQSLVIRRMVADLDVPILIRVCPIIREPDGLAMSSRNVYLSADERRRALSLSQSLRKATELVGGGERNAALIREAMKKVLDAAGGVEIDYVAVADRDTLQELEQLKEPAVALVAARVGTTRLIDNELL